MLTRDAAIAVSVSHTRIELQRLIKIRYRPREVPFVKPGRATIEPGFNQGRIERDRAVEIAQGALRLAFRQPRSAAIAVESRLLRVERDGAVEIGERAVQFAFLMPRQPAIAPGLGDLRRLPYLIKSFAVSYAPSASVLARLRNESRTAAPKAFVAYADPVYDQNAETVNASTERAASAGAHLSLNRLPHSRREAEGIAKLFGSGEADLFLGAAAGETLISFAVSFG